MGLVLVAFGTAMREPVTTISSILGSAAFEGSAGGGCCAEALMVHRAAISMAASVDILRAATL